MNLHRFSCHTTILSRLAATRMMLVVIAIIAVLYPCPVASFLTTTPLRQRHVASHPWSRIAFSSPTSTSTSSSTDTDTDTDTETATINTKIPDTSPLPPHTFAGMVEAGLQERFGEDDCARIIESWRLLERDYEHREFVGNSDNSESEINPAESNCHQHCHSYVPGLKAVEFWDTTADEQQDVWAKKLSKQYKALKKEFTQVTADMEQLTEKGNNIWAGALTEDASSYGVGWKTLVLMNRGQWDPVNVNLFPVTAKAVRDSGIPAMEVFFASMQPNTSIQMHTDFTNFVLTSHLALDIPYSGENKCRLTVGDQTREWINGQVMLFDTSILHDAVNESDKTRYILMFRVWHPDLTQTERDALQFTYDCLELPGLVSPDPGERLEAEEMLKVQRAFPEIKKGSSVVQGFGGGGAAAKTSKRKPKK
jgi:aspartyl/asparaginyl beta-hydroxylase (cupin superfamily)